MFKIFIELFEKVRKIFEKVRNLNISQQQEKDT